MATVATALRAVRTRLTETPLQLLLTITDTVKTETLRSATDRELLITNSHFSPFNYHLWPSIC